MLDGEVVQLVGHFQHEQVVHGEEVEDPAIHPEQKRNIILRIPQKMMCKRLEIRLPEEVGLSSQ